MHRFIYLLIFFHFTSFAKNVEQSSKSSVRINIEKEDVKEGNALKKIDIYDNNKIKKNFQEFGGTKAENGALKESAGGYGKPLQDSAKQQGRIIIINNKNSYVSTDRLYKKDEVKTRHEKMIKTEGREKEFFYSPTSGRLNLNPTAAF